MKAETTEQEEPRKKQQHYANQAREQKERGSSVMAQMSTQCRKERWGGSTKGSITLETVLLSEFSEVCKDSLRYITNSQQSGQVQKLRGGDEKWTSGSTWSLPSWQGTRTSPIQLLNKPIMTSGGKRNASAITPARTQWSHPALLLPTRACDLEPQFPHLSNEIKTTPHSRMVRDRWSTIYIAPHSEPGTLISCPE